MNSTMKALLIVVAIVLAGFTLRAFAPETPPMNSESQEDCAVDERIDCPERCLTEHNCCIKSCNWVKPNAKSACIKHCKSSLQKCYEECDKKPAAVPKSAAFQMLQQQGDTKAGPAFHRFKVGDFTITALHDGGWDYPPGFLLGGLAGEAEMQKRYGLEGENPTIWSPYTVLFVDTGTNKVLLDTGAGKKPFAPTAGKMFESMKMAGITPTDVDTVVITHAHPDHIAGLMDESGNLIFSNAKYYVGKAEYDFWGTEGLKEKLGDTGWLVDIALVNLNAIKDKAIMVDAETEIVPGMKAVPLSGHTPGHFMVEMATAGTNLWYVSDLFVMDFYVEHPEKRPGVIPGERKELLIEDTKKILARAAAEDPMIVAMHLPPFPSLGKIVEEGDGYKWQPVK